MATITTLRPSSTSSVTGWTIVPSGTAHGVTSDNSDSTYVQWSGSGTPLVLQTPIDSPPINHRRHQVRVRVRGRDSNAWWAVRLASGALTGSASADFPASFTTSTGSWGFGAPPDGATTLAAHILGQVSGVKLSEVYLDVDSRQAPDFDPQVLDGSGASVTTVSDTATPSLHTANLYTDDLAQREYRYWVTQGSDIVWDSGVLSGTFTDQATSPLENGAYTAHMQVWTTLGGNIAYPSEEKTLAFTVSVGQVQRPLDPVAVQIAGTPLYEIEACAPHVGQMDDEVAYIELQRVDCALSDDPVATTIAMLGPLATDECATWTDYSFPRTGLGATCTEPAEQCCSYYRARTIGRVDGSIVISLWSDVRDTGVPTGLIFAWPGTEASIPAGWDRTTALDGQYPKGIATSTTQPGAVGGTSLHSHQTATHMHDMSHSHTVTGNTSAAVGSVTSGDGAAGTTAVLASHTHTRPATNTFTGNSTTTAVSPGDVANDLDRLEVVFIESDGSPAGVPSNALGLAPDASYTGWTDYANATDRYLKGAAPAGNGGATGAGTLANHTHSIPNHTHGNGTSHSHVSANTGSVSSTMSLFSGPNNVTWAASHSHTITVGSSAFPALQSGGSGTSGAASTGAIEPPFRTVRIKQNTSGGTSLPAGIIGLWRGSLGTIPAAWSLCDGTGGTPDLIARYPKGATSSIGTAGGSLAAHSHTSPPHTHTTTAHSHTETIGASTAVTANTQTAATVTVATGTHSHTAGSTDSVTPTVGSSTSGTLADLESEPLHEEVAFVQLTGTPSVLPDPEVMCLEWDEGEHLIRSTGPDGALWVPVAGKFTWDVERPFTSAAGVNGTRFVTSAEPGGRNLTMTAAVESEEELSELQEILERPLVLISPSDSTEVWAAPVAASVRVFKVGRIRQVTAEFIGTGPQPGPQVADV